jgi:hypothetical protein
MEKTPYAAVVRNRVAAESMASVRNAILIEYQGKINSILDWWRRDDQNRPMPAEMRELKAPLSWVAAPHPRL